MRTKSTLLLLALTACEGSNGTTSTALRVVVGLPEVSTLVDDLEASWTLEGVGSEDAVWTWTVDGQPTDWHSTAVPSSALALGQSWTVTVGVERDGSRESATATTRIDRVGGNVLILLVDDLGIDKVGLYGVHDVVPPTPTIDGLADDGVLFRNFWVQPTCSPTRASMLTGRYPRRHGVGRWIFPPEQARGIDDDEVLLSEMLASAPVHYEDAGVGKWHLTGYVDNPEPGMDPLTAGFTWFAGTLGNPDNSFTPSGPLSKGYRHWEKSTNGVMSFETDYLTTVTTDDALERVHAMPEPWMLYVAYNAPHSPLHVPPAHLHPYNLDESASDFDKYDAMVAALDTEMGRLLEGIDPEMRARTTVIFMSDNGSPEHAVRPPLDPERRKGTVYEGGVNVPMIVTGPMVTHPGMETLALVESVDLFATVAELAGVDLQQVIDPRTDQPVLIDGISFLPHLVDPAAPSTRTRAYSSKHYPNGPPPHDWEQDVLRDEQYKVSYTSFGTWYFFEYVGPFDEGEELLVTGSLTPAQEEAFDRLSAELGARVDEMDFGP